MSGLVKVGFGAVPAGALHDNKLSSLDVRVLGEIARRDRFNRNGKGRFASNATIGEEVGCHPESVGRCIRKLLKRGHVKDLNAQEGRRRSRKRLLVVVYHDFLRGDREGADAPQEPDRNPARTQPQRLDEPTHVTVDNLKGETRLNGKALAPKRAEWGPVSHRLTCLLQPVALTTVGV